jgi:hypothetical protein
MTSEPKVYIPFFRQFGHFMTDTVGEVTRQIELRNGYSTLNLVVPPISRLDKNGGRSAMEVGATVLDYFLTAFERTGVVNLIKLAYPDRKEFVAIPAKNISVFLYIECNATDVRRIRKFCRSLPEISEETTLSEYRKIYLSRTGTEDTTEISPELYKDIKDDPYVDYPGSLARIFSEGHVSGFMHDTAGFHTRVPEEQYPHFGSQVTEMSQANVLMSVTSSGLLNMFFMPEESTIIELVTPLTTIDHHKKQLNQAYHIQYPFIAYALGFNYIGIPHNRYPEDIKDRIKKTAWYQTYKTNNL